MWTPDIGKKTQFTTDRPESCTAQINIRIPPSLKDKLKDLDGWQEKVRRFLEEEVEEKERSAA